MSSARRRPSQEINGTRLFPQQVRKKALGRPYAALLKRVTRLLARHAGVQIHPHLYRHLLGWIWLKNSSDHLPKVQRLLGHKDLRTALEYHAELDDELALDQWSDYLDKKRSKWRRKAA